MRVVVLTTLLLVSGISLASAQEPPKPAVSGDKERRIDQPRDQGPAREAPDISRGRDDGRGVRERDDRETTSDPRMRRGDREVEPDREAGRGRAQNRDGDRMGRDERDGGPGPMMRRYHDSTGDPGRYQDRGDRGWDRAPRERDDMGASGGEGLRRRVKVCIEYENGDEYCRYRQ